MTDPRLIKLFSGPDTVYRHGDSDMLWSLVKAGDSEQSEAGTFTTFVASTADVDRMGDVVDQTTWRLRNWRQNPVILYEHAHPVVGRGVGKLNKDEGRLEIRVQWDIGPHNPIGTLAGTQHLNGFRSAGSVGFIPGKAVSRADLDDGDPRKSSKDTPRWKAGHVFMHNELLEFSSVAIPANAAALQLGLYAREADDPDEQVKRMLDGSAERTVRDLVLDAIRNDPEIAKAVRGMIWATPGTDTNDLSDFLKPRKGITLESLFKRE